MNILNNVFGFIAFVFNAQAEAVERKAQSRAELAMSKVQQQLASDTGLALMLRSLPGFLQNITGQAPPPPPPESQAPPDTLLCYSDKNLAMELVTRHLSSPGCDVDLWEAVRYLRRFLKFPEQLARPTWNTLSVEPPPPALARLDLKDPPAGG